MAVILGVLSVNLTLPGQVRVARDTFIEIASRLLRQEPVRLRFNLAEAFCGAGPGSEDEIEYGLVWALWKDTARWRRGPRWLSHTSPAPVPPVPGPGT